VIKYKQQKGNAMTPFTEMHQIALRVLRNKQRKKIAQIMKPTFERQLREELEEMPPLPKSKRKRVA
jgi:hypothetical protein